MGILDTSKPFTLFTSNFPSEDVKSMFAVGVKNKRRPVLFIKKLSNNSNYAQVYEVTSIQHPGIPQYKIENWAQAGLRKPSYINISQVILINIHTSDLIHIGELDTDDIVNFSDSLTYMKPKLYNFANIKYEGLNMKFLKESYGQSEDLDAFVAQAKGRFRKYYIVSFDIKDTGEHQEEYFAFEDAAREYYNNLLEDIRTEYDWDAVDVYLYKVDISSAQEELENDLIINDEEEIEEDEEFEDEE